MQLTRVQHRSNESVRLFFDGEETARLELPVDLFLDAGLASGDDLSEARYRELRERAEVALARESALRLLAHRARAREELRRRLRRKDHPERAIEEVLRWLDERGYVDDDAFAESFIRDRLRLRPRGPFALAQELRAKGVSAETAERVVARVMDAEGVDEAGLARQAAEAWARKNPSLRDPRDRDEYAAARRRLYGHLARRGFGGEALREAIEAVLSDPPA